MSRAENVIAREHHTANLGLSSATGFNLEQLFLSFNGSIKEIPVVRAIAFRAVFFKFNRPRLESAIGLMLKESLIQSRYTGPGEIDPKLILGVVPMLLRKEAGSDFDSVFPFLRRAILVGDCCRVFQSRQARLDWVSGSATAKSGTHHFGTKSPDW